MNLSDLAHAIAVEAVYTVYCEYLANLIVPMKPDTRRRFVTSSPVAAIYWQLLEQAPPCEAIYGA